VTTNKADEATISRDYDGKHYVQFEKAGIEPSVDTATVKKEVESATLDIAAAKPVEGDEAIKGMIDGALGQATELLKEQLDSTLDVETRKTLLEAIDVTLADVPKHSVIAARHGQLVDAIKKLDAQAPAGNWQKARDLVFKQLPSFVYYSNYGNL